MHLLRAGMGPKAEWRSGLDLVEKNCQGFIRPWVQMNEAHSLVFVPRLAEGNYRVRPPVSSIRGARRLVFVFWVGVWPISGTSNEGPERVEKIAFVPNLPSSHKLLDERKNKLMKIKEDNRDKIVYYHIDMLITDHQPFYYTILLYGYTGVSLWVSM